MAVPDGIGVSSHQPETAIIYIYNYGVKLMRVPPALRARNGY